MDAWDPCLGCSRFGAQDEDNFREAQEHVRKVFAPPTIRARPATGTVLKGGACTSWRQVQLASLDAWCACRGQECIRCWKHGVHGSAAPEW